MLGTEAVLMEHTWRSELVTVRPFGMGNSNRFLTTHKNCTKESSSHVDKNLSLTLFVHLFKQRDDIVVHLIGVCKIPSVCWVQGENYYNRNVNPTAHIPLSEHF